MELRPGPGGNEAEVAARLRQMLLDVTTTEKQIQGEIDRLTAQRARLVEQSAAVPAANQDLRRRVDEAIAQIDTQLLDLRLQLDSVAQSRSEIAGQVRGFSQLATTAEAEANITELRRVFAMADLDEPAASAGVSDQSAPDPRAELAKASVDEELAALRREMGLPDPAPPPAPPVAEGQRATPAGNAPPEAGPPAENAAPPREPGPLPNSTKLPATSTAPVPGPAADPPNVPQPGTVLDPPPAEPTLPGLPEPKEPPTPRR